MFFGFFFCFFDITVSNHLPTITDWKEAFEFWRKFQDKVGEEDWRCYASHFAWGMIMSTQFHCWIYAWKFWFPRICFILGFGLDAWIGIKCLYFSFMLWFHAIDGWLEQCAKLAWPIYNTNVMVSGFHVCFWMNIPLLAFV